MGENNLLNIENLNISLKIEKSYVNIINGVNIALKKGEVIALVGESGCGKTVTSQAILRILPPELEITSGRILFNLNNNKKLIDISRIDPKGKIIRKIRGRYIGVIFQEPMSSFSPVYTIGYQIVEAILTHRKITKDEALSIAIELLRKVEIPNPEVAVKQYPHEFSGGMRQRAMIARAIVNNPLLLIADEPTTALDVTIQAQIIKLLKDLQEEYGMSVIFITHNLGVVAQIADRVVIMYMGRVVEEGTTKEIFYNSKHPYTVSLIQAIPKLGNLSERRKLQPIYGDVPNIFNRPMGCEFHTRCKHFIAGKCDVNFPKVRKINDNHKVWCYLYDQYS